MKLIGLVLTLLISASAFAYKDGTYRCKKSDESIPPNEYTIETIHMGSHKLPYVEIKQHYRLGDENSAIQTTNIKGIAQLASIGSNREIMSLAAIRLEFENDELQNCRQQ